MTSTIEISTQKIELIEKMFNKAKVFDKAKRALSKSPVKIKTWSMSSDGDHTRGYLKLEVYDYVGRTIASITITSGDRDVNVEYKVTTNTFRNYTEWVKYLNTNAKKYYKESKIPESTEDFQRRVIKGKFPTELKLHTGT